LNYPVITAILLSKLDGKIGEKNKIEVDCEKLKKAGEITDILPCVNIQALSTTLNKYVNKNSCIEKLKKEVDAYLGQKYNIKEALPSYPAIEFLEELAKAMGILPEKYIEAYDNYSRFIHAYDATRVPAPFTSIAEAAILAEELSRFNSLFNEMLDKHLRLLRKL